MARNAFTVPRRIMLEQCIADRFLEIVVAIVTEFADIFCQQLFLI
jgi:hypothetical protein